MYSPELEELIEAILADGIITEKERSVLHKRALSEGVDPDELDVIIDGRLVLRKSSPPPIPSPVNNPSNSETPNIKSSIKHGVIRKCPHCGEIVEAGSGKCKLCGLTFAGVEANNSRQRLAAVLEEVEKRDYNSKGLVGLIFGDIYADDEKEEARARAITNFPVPNTKEDLLEFILYLEPLSKVTGIMNKMVARLNSDPNRFTQAAYKSKYEECVKKARAFFPDDPQFLAILPKK